ncbi:MAG: 1-deoxy-D-xylulose-5-phosphate synthase [Eubacteriales bacterium]|nr:1-deoxy-D-xylulose-5-phosphate synthase [Eubacteriales bacterium]
MYLEKINGPKDVKTLSLQELTALAQEMREALFHRLTKTGGHFGPNFGMVEATIAMHYVFDSPTDKFVFDVSHQTYPHKMLTGRAYGYLDETRFYEISGYSNPDESEHDFFTIGHTSTSVSLATGLAKGRDVTGGKENIIAVIGDGSLSGGEALEGLDFAGEMKSNLIVVVNDNEQSIAENHGGLYKNLKELRDTNGTASNNLFRAMGLDYIYQEEGNNIAKLIETFQKVKDIDHPIVVHIHTQKGKGYALAERNREDWHWCMPFDRETGKPTISFEGEDYSALSGAFILKKMKEDSSVVFVTAAVPDNVGFPKENREKAGKQFVDVGIAEEQAVAMCSGIAKNGGKAIFGTNATFIQRTYDQFSQDVCINGSPITTIINYTSVMGLGDVTHLGIYTISMLSNIPELVYLSPTCKEEYLAMLAWSIDQQEHPVVISIPGNGVHPARYPVAADYSQINRYQVCEQGSDVAILALGDFFQLGEEAAEEIMRRTGKNVTLINPRFASGLDEDLLEELKQQHRCIVTLEDGILDGGFGQRVAAFYGSSETKVLNFGLKKAFYDRYDVMELMKKNHLTPAQIAEDVIDLLG